MIDCDVFSVPPEFITGVTYTDDSSDFDVTTAIPFHDETTEEHPTDAPLRLPRSWQPLHYNLDLTPDFYDPDVDAVFSGSVEMFLLCAESTNEIAFNSQVQLDVDSLQVLAEDDTTLNFTDPPLCRGAQDICILRLDEEVREGEQVRLSVNFTGLIQPNLDGLYLMQYDDSNGTTRYLFLTMHLSNSS